MQELQGQILLICARLILILCSRGHVQQLPNPWAQLLKPTTPEPRLCTQRSHSEKPVSHNSRAAPASLQLQRSPRSNERSQETNHTDHMAHSLVWLKLWATPCGASKADGSWWNVLTKCGPLEKGMANHFSILTSRTPWTKTQHSHK